MDTYHPIDWTQFVVANSGAYPLPQEVALVPPRAWWTLPQLNTPFTQERKIASVMEPTRYNGDGTITYGVMQGYHSFGQYRGWFAESGEVPARVIGPAIEHFPPGATTWPDDIKPQYRVPDHTGVHYHTETWTAGGDSDAEWSGEAGTGGNDEGTLESEGQGDADWRSVSHAHGTLDAPGTADNEWHADAVEARGTLEAAGAGAADWQADPAVVAAASLDAPGTADAQFFGEAVGKVDGVFAMAGEGVADFYSDNVPPGGFVPGYYHYPPPKQKRKKVIVRATMDCQLPALDSHIDAHVTARAVLRAVMDNRLHAMTGNSWARVRNAATGNDTPLPVLRAALKAAAVNRAAMRNTPGPLTATARARSLARATVQADVAVSGTSTARVRVAGRADVQLPAASIRAAGTAKALPPTDLDAELLLIAAQLLLLDEDEEDWDG